jgi:hypothetical protein
VDDGDVDDGGSHRDRVYVRPQRLCPPRKTSCESPR